MNLIILLALLVLALFGCVSISQSYASAKQAQAVIETNHTAQLALSGQIATSIIFAIIALVFLIALMVLMCLLFKENSSQKAYPTQEEKTAPTPLHLPASWDEKDEDLLTLPSGWDW